MKTLDEYFCDWESTAFGFGYGNGEHHILQALKSFFEAVGTTDRPNSYEYEKLEAAVTPTVAWLLINRLCRHDIQAIEYGSSPRFGWLTPEGVRLKHYLATKTADELYQLVCGEDHNICYPDACNCGPNGYEEGRICQNPFWPHRPSPPNSEDAG